MKKVKILFLSILTLAGMLFMPHYNGNSVRAGEEITVSSTSDITLVQAVEQAKSGDTIIISGAIVSSEIELPQGVTLKGIDNAVIDFSSSKNGQDGITINKNKCVVQDIEIVCAKDNAISITGNNNTLENLNVHDNAGTGIELSDGAANNYIYKVKSHHNVNWESEEVSSDGFAVTNHAGKGNVFERCIANNNADDGFDLTATHGAVTFKSCKALNNGNAYGIKGDGSGFKLGGIDDVTTGVKAHLDPLQHKLDNCVAEGNTGSGFDRSYQKGVVTMKNCTANKNEESNYNFPDEEEIEALGSKVSFGKAKLINCESTNGENNISGANVTGQSTGF